MSVSGTSNDYQASLTQVGQFFSQLGQDLQSVNSTNSQSFFAQLQQDLQAIQSSQPQSSLSAGSSGAGQNSINTDINALGQDLQSGNLTDAQSVFAQLQQDIQAAQSHHHHRCCDDGSNEGQASGSQGTGTNSINSDLSTLGQALQSNGTTDAQSALAQLQQDIQSLQGHHHHTSSCGERRC